MAVIRTYPLGGVESRPLPSVATPLGAVQGMPFAGAQGQALIQSGQSLQQAGQTLDAMARRVKAQDDETWAREADTAFNAEMRPILYDPEKGYYAMRGKAAYEGAMPTMKALDDLRKKYLDGAGNDAQRNMLARTLGARVDGVSDGIARHASVQRLAWQDSANAAVVADARTSGATFFNDDKLRDQEYARGRNTIIMDAESKNEPPEVTTKRLRDFDSDFHAGVVRRYISADDPNGARRYYDANQKMFGGDEAIKLERELKDATVSRRAQQISGLVAATGGVSPNYNARVAGAESGSPSVENKIGALGKYQMIPGTYTSLAQETEWGKGKSQTEIRQMLLDGKAGEAKQDELQGLYNARSTKALQEKGVPVNDLTLYTTHFLGHGAGPEILKLPDDTPLQAGLLKAHGGDGAFVQKVNAANPFLAKVETVGDLKALLAQRIGAPGALARSGTPERPNLDAMLSAGLALAGDDPDLRDRVASRVKTDYATKLQVYNTAMADLEKKAFAHIDAGGDVGTLPADVRGGLDSDSLTKVQAYEARVLEKRRKEKGEEAQKALTDLEGLNQLQVEDVEKVRNHLTASEYRSWRKIAAGEDRADDAGTYERLQRGMGTRDMRDDIFAAHNAGEISNATRNAFLAKNDTFLKEGAPSSPYKLGHDYVTRALDPGLMGAGISRQTAAAGIKEYDQYVAANPQREQETAEQYAKRLDQFAQDTVKRWSLINTQEMGVSLPVPAHTTFDRSSMSNLPKPEAQKQISRAYQDLQRAFAEQRITQDQLDADAIALMKWLDFVQKRPDAPATPAQKK